MKNLIYSLQWATLTFLPLINSCYDDKGNYDYADVETIQITLPENIVVMSRAENIKFDPVVVSSFKGEIQAGDPDYEYSCKLNYRHLNAETRLYDNWVDIDEGNSKDVDFFADFPAGNYPLWYSVTNKRTGVTTNAKGTVSVLSSVFEGWMVLSNVGTSHEVRLDMISRNSKGDIVVATGVQGDNGTQLYDATQLVMTPSKYANGESVFLLSHSGGYRLDPQTLVLQESNNMKMTDFIMPTTPGNPLSMILVNNQNLYGPTSRLCVTDLGNAYAITSATSGASFESPLNTDQVGNEPTYRVSPMTGTSMARTGNSSCALLYDVTNCRFMGWNYNASQNKLLFTLADPDAEEKKFSYQTGMELIEMEGTRYSNGLVYSVLQDKQGKRYLYGINLSGSRFTQESYYDQISAEHFNDAAHYAFHSQFPFMFYSHNNKVYSYNLGTGLLNEILTLDANEQVTMLKFNLFANMNLAELSDHSEEFLAKQYQLIVASTTSDDNGGIVRFYQIDISGKMKMVEEHVGFGRIVDVTYRERR